MGLGKNSGNFGNKTFVNISKGKLYTKQTGEEPVLFDFITGKIVNVVFKTETYEGQSYEKAELHIKDNEETYILSMRLNSGYFRGFVNSFKNADINREITIAPNMKTINDKTTTTCFVIQDEKPLKHYYTKDNQGDFPQMQKVRVNSKDIWDGTEQIEFWKKWLNGIKWTKPVVEEITEDELTNEYSTKEEPVDDLPF